MKKKYSICYNPDIENSSRVMEELKLILENQNIEYKVLNIDNLSPDVDFAFIIGGDGTILKAARFYSKYGIPIFGINLGHLGFLSQTGVNNLQSIVQKIIGNNFKTEKRIMLELGGYNALNDFVIKGEEQSRACTFMLEIDGKFVCKYFADGLIISTPTGSTAYGMAAGGPVLYPSLDVLEIVPICPHTFSSRPLVVPADSEIKIFENELQKYIVCADGQEIITLKSDIIIRKSDNYANLALLNENDFYHILRDKLQWGISPSAGCRHV